MFIYLYIFPSGHSDFHFAFTLVVFSTLGTFASQHAADVVAVLPDDHSTLGVIGLPRDLYVRHRVYLTDVSCMSQRSH